VVRVANVEPAGKNGGGGEVVEKIAGGTVVVRYDDVAQREIAWVRDGGWK